MENLFKQMCLFVLLIFGFFALAYPQADNGVEWTQFRGKDRAGISAEKILKTDWPTLKPELVWKKEIGAGYSEIITSDGIIYTMISEKIDSLSGFEYLVSYDANNGDEIWRSKVGPMYIDSITFFGDGPRSTPTIDEEHIYSFSGLGMLSAHSKNTGNIIWQHDFVKEFGSVIPQWGFSSSPIIFGDKLIMEAGGKEENAFIAFDKMNGKILWSKEQGDVSYNSPLLININNQEQIIFTNRNTIYSLDHKGDTLWTYKMSFANAVAMPVFIEPNKIFVSFTKFVIVEVGNDNVFESISGVSMRNDFSSSCYFDGYLYGFHNAFLRCISAKTGEEKWTKRGFGKGNLIMVGDKLLILSDKGVLALVEVNPEVYKEIGSIQAIEGKSWTSPSFSKGKIYIRNLTEMVCYKFN